MKRRLHLAIATWHPSLRSRDASLLLSVSASLPSSPATVSAKFCNCEYLPTPVDLPSQSLAQNRQYRDNVTCLPTHTEQICHGCEDPKNLYQKWQSLDTALTNTPTEIKKRSRTLNEPMMHDNDKTCLTFQSTCLCPNSCATNDDRQMRMTDKDTPHAPKIMLTSIGSQQWTIGNTPIKDRYRWPHRP